MTSQEKTLLKSIAWDVSIDSIDLKKHSYWLISRIIVFGLPEHIKWMWKNYNEDEIKQTVMQSKTLDVKSANFWAVHYNIDKSKIACLNKPLMNGYF